MYTATCLCGACKIDIDKIIATGICHCTTCRKMTSSAFSLNTMIRTDNFHLRTGTPKILVLPNKAIQNFCGDCGSVLWIDWPQDRDLKILKTGVLDGEDALDLDVVKPATEQFTVRRPAWMCAVDSARQIERQIGTEDALETLASIESKSKSH